jgi:hypothetical protein
VVNFFGSGSAVVEAGERGPAGPPPLAGPSPASTPAPVVAEGLDAQRCARAGELASVAAAMSPPMAGKGEEAPMAGERAGRAGADAAPAEAARGDVHMGGATCKAEHHLVAGSGCLKRVLVLANREEEEDDEDGGVREEGSDEPSRTRVRLV